MTGLVAKLVLGKIFKESANNKFGREDPYYEYPAEELNKAGKKKSKRRKKALPPGLTDEEGQILTKVKRRAYRLDMSWGSFLGIRFGWSSIIGIVPAIGDVIDALLALMVVKTAMKVALPTGILIHMLFNIILDFLLGLVPFIGDLADAGYKCNTKNAVLLENHLRELGKKRLKEQGINPNQIEDPSLPSHDDHDSPTHDVDLESQVPAPERSYNGGGRRDDRYVERDDRRDRDGRRDRERERDRSDRRDEPTRSHSKTIKKAQRDGSRRGR